MSEIKNGCYDRAPFKTTILVQDGYTDKPWTTDKDDGSRQLRRAPLWKEVPVENTYDCQYSKLTSDLRCVGCKHNQRPTEVQEQVAGLQANVDEYDSKFQAYVGKQLGLSPAGMRDIAAQLEADQVEYRATKTRASLAAPDKVTITFPKEFHLKPTKEGKS